MSRRLWIFGDGNFADMAHYLFSTDSAYEVAGFTVDSSYLKRDGLNGLPIIAYEEFLRQAGPAEVDVFVAIGVTGVNRLRAQKVAQLANDGYRLASFVSSHARVPQGLQIHPNTMIMDQVNIHPKVRIGADTVIWSNSRIALNACIGDHVWITSAVIGDATEIGDYSFVGLNATIAPFLKVGRHNLIGAAAVILKDTQDHQVYRGPRSVASKVSTLRLGGARLIR
jgi:sugar O-acyltransferase (sialic acid O-acetyltransferase NeuD family)